MRGTRARRAHTSKLVTTNVDAVSVTSMPASWPDASNMWRSTKRTNRVSIGGQARVLATSRVSPVRPHKNLFREFESSGRRFDPRRSSKSAPPRLPSVVCLCACGWGLSLALEFHSKFGEINFHRRPDMLVFALQAAAFMSPRHMLSVPCSAQAQCTTLASALTSPRAFTAVTMVLPRGNKDPNFDPDNVDPEAFKKTASRTAVVWGALGSIVYLVTSSGKEFNQMNAPGYSEQAKRTAEGKAAYLKELKDREAALAEKTRADREAGRKQSAPPKPWEK